MDVCQSAWEYNILTSEQKLARLGSYDFGSFLVPALRYWDEILPEVLIGI